MQIVKKDAGSMLLHFLSMRDFFFNAKSIHSASTVSHFRLKLGILFDKGPPHNINCYAFVYSGLHFIVEVCKVIGRDSYVYQEELKKLLGAE